MTSRQLDEERIFHVARGIPEEDLRSEYLDQICAGDQALRERVEGLLEVHEQEQSFLKSNGTVEPTIDHSPISEGPGQQIGRYKLLQKIGEGGFGVVYMAEQARPVRRKVALKIIKPGMDTHAVIARFEAERQALALMDHANIARVLDGGATEAGRPYFVMELVKGVPLTEYCDKNQLNTQDRLKLFVTVCQAVQHAHQKGIIHRDLKPSNILVTLHDGKPEIKVIDFGVAKAINQQLTEKTLFTAFGQMVGTPQYMSPEQAEMSGLDVDTRSDIYSLGVLLYELLTGTTPLESERLRTAGYAEMQRLIREEEPPKPSTRLSTAGEELTVVAKHRSVSPDQLRRAVRGDLDWIVMKALAKDRSRRYDAANRLSEDIDRFLNSGVVEARPPSKWYQLQKMIRRNSVLCVTSGLIFLALMTGLTVAAIALRNLAVERQRLVEILDRLHETRAEKIAEFVFTGEFDEANRELKKTTELGNVLGWPGESRGWQLFNESHIAVHQGEHQKARELLFEAKQLLPESGACASLLVANERLAGFEWDYWLGLAELDAQRPETFEDHLFRGFAYSWAAPDLGVADLRKARELRPASAVARFLLSQALYNQAQHAIDRQESLQCARDAVGEAEIGTEMLTADSPFAANARLLAKTKLFQLTELLHEPDSAEVRIAREKLLDEIAKAKTFTHHPQCHYALALADGRLNPQTIASGAAVFRRSGTANVKEMLPVSQIELTFHYARSDYEKCESLIDGIEPEIREHISYLLLIQAEIDYAKHCDPSRLKRETVERLQGPQSKKRDLQGALDWVLLKLVGADEEACKRGADFLRHCNTYGTRNELGGITQRLRPMAHAMLTGRFDRTVEEYLADANSTRLSTFILFRLGVVELTKGNRRKAKNLFEKVVDAGFFEMADDGMARAILMRINDAEWLPWLPNDGSLAGT